MLVSVGFRTCELVSVYTNQNANFLHINSTASNVSYMSYKLLINTLYKVYSYVLSIPEYIKWHSISGQYVYYDLFLVVVPDTLPVSTNTNPAIIQHIACSSSNSSVLAALSGNIMAQEDYLNVLVNCPMNVTTSIFRMVRLILLCQYSSLNDVDEIMFLSAIERQSHGHANIPFSAKGWFMSHNSKSCT